MNKKISLPIKIFLILFSLLMIGAVAFIALIFVWITTMYSEIHREEEYMQKPEIYESVGRTLALYSQSDPKFFPEEDFIDSAWLPAELHDIGGNFYELDSSGSRIEMGGGFYHYGYLLRLDEQASTSDINVWDFYFYREDHSPELLETFSLSASETISAEVLFSNVLASYNKSIIEDPSVLWYHQRRIQLLLDFDKISEARDAVQDSLDTLPNDSWLILVQALIVHETHSSAKAEQFLIAWVKRAPSFIRYIDLAYYYQLQQQPQEAAQAMIEATQYGVNDYDGYEEFRGFNAAMYAFNSQEYEAAIKLSDKLSESDAKSDFRMLREAAIRNLEGEKITIDWPQDVGIFDPFNDVDINKLLYRTIERPTRENH